MNRSLIVAISTALLGAGCNIMSDVVQTRAASDLSCPAEQIKVTEIGGTSYKAEGCDQSETYDCAQSVARSAEVVCVPEGHRDDSAHEEASSKESRSDSGESSAADPPTSAAGFNLGSTVDDAKAACEKSGNQWSDSAAPNYTCSGTASDIGMPATVRLTANDSRITTIAVVVATEDQGKLLKSMADLKAALAGKYHDPADSDSNVPGECAERPSAAASWTAARASL